MTIACLPSQYQVQAGPWPLCTSDHDLHQLQASPGVCAQVFDDVWYFLQVLFAGTPAQVTEAIDAAEPFKEDLVERGVLLVPLPIYSGESSEDTSVAPLEADDLRYECQTIRGNAVLCHQPYRTICHQPYSTN